MHTVTESVIAAVVLTSWVWAMSLLAFNAISARRRDRARFEAATKPVARVECAGDPSDFDVLDLDGRFMYGLILPETFAVCTFPDGTVSRAALDLLNERATERYTYPTPVR